MGNTVRVYSLDASVVIDLFEHYPDDIFPPIWEALDVLAGEKRIVMAEQAKNECHDQQAKDWLGKHKDIVMAFSPMLNECMLDLMADLAKAGLQLIRPTSPKNAGDPWVIAAAMAYNRAESGKDVGHACVLTSEKPAGENAIKVKIPNVCARRGIEYVNFIELMRLEDWKLEKLA